MFCFTLDGKFREVYRGLHTEYAAEGLRPGGTYKLRVVAEGQGGRGTVSFRRNYIIVLLF